MRRFYSLGVAAIALIAAQSHAGIVAGPLTNPLTGGTCYLLTQNSWTGSEAEAVSMGGHLITVHDLAENTWVVNTFSEYGGVHRALWIGLTDQTTENTFTWINGDSSSYRNWAVAFPGHNPEPNNDLGVEDWTHILPSTDFRYGTWNDGPNSATALGFSMFGVVQVIPEPVIATLGCAGAILVSRRRR